MRSNYLNKTRNKHIFRVKFDILQGDIFITPKEVFETFADIDKDFPLVRDRYEIMVDNAMIIHLGIISKFRFWR